MKKVLSLSVLALTIASCSAPMRNIMPGQMAPSGPKNVVTVVNQPSDGTMQPNGVAANTTMTNIAVARVNPTGPVGGHVGRSMDSLDRTKMLRALDSGLGKPTQWKNPVTGVNYTVVPIAKLSMNGNPFCRRYHTIAYFGEKKQEFNGIACVSPEGDWQEVS